MFSQPVRLVAILVLGLAITTQAFWLDVSFFGRRFAASQPQIERKQVASVVSGIATAVSGVLLGTGQATPTNQATTISPSIPSTSDTPTVTNTPTSTPATTTSPSTSSTPVSQKSSSIPSSTPTSQSSSSRVSESSQSSQTSQILSSQSQSVVLFTSVLTVSGSTITSVSSSTSTDTSKPTSTSGASLNNGGSSSSSGMSSKTKTTVIGVVVGIGGAIILAGLGVVAYRIWGRKKDNDDDDGLMGYRRTGSGHEKSGSISGGVSNPFQTTLESYHGPSKTVNASSNF